MCISSVENTVEIATMELARERSGDNCETPHLTSTLRGGGVSLGSIDGDDLTPPRSEPRLIPLSDWPWGQPPINSWPWADDARQRLAAGRSHPSRSGRGFTTPVSDWPLAGHTRQGSGRGFTTPVKRLVAGRPQPLGSGCGIATPSKTGRGLTTPNSSGEGRPDKVHKQSSLRNVQGLRSVRAGQGVHPASHT